MLEIPTSPKWYILHKRWNNYLKSDHILKENIFNAASNVFLLFLSFLSFFHLSCQHFTSLHTKLLLTNKYSKSPPYVTSKLQAFKAMNICSHVQSLKLVYVSGIYCHVHTSPTSSCPFMYFLLLSTIYSINTIFISSPGCPGSKCKSNGDKVGIIVIFKVLYYELKNVLFFVVFLFFVYYLYEKYYKPITVKYYIADCSS